MTELLSRDKPTLGAILNALDKRMTLLPNDRLTLQSIQKGNEGECYFDSLMTQYVNCESIALKNLVIVHNGIIIQIDSLLITSNGVYLYEVKNYAGDYSCQNSQIKSLHRSTYLDPIAQLERTTTVINNLLTSWNYRMPISAQVVFVHPTFVLYEAKVGDPILFLPQLPRHLKKVNQKADYLDKRHHALAENLLQEASKDVPFERKLPDYSYEQLKKGLTCVTCGSFDLVNNSKSSWCKTCGEHHSLNEMILHQIKEFRLLFPNEPVTRNIIHEWCGGQLTERRVYSLLQSTFKRVGQGKSSYYI